MNAEDWAATLSSVEAVIIGVCVEHDSGPDAETGMSSVQLNWAMPEQERRPLRELVPIVNGLVDQGLVRVYRKRRADGNVECRRYRITGLGARVYQAREKQCGAR